jgi:LysM repeat protein
MYNHQDEYIEATKDASINTCHNKKISNKKLIVLNLFLATTLGFVGYIGFDSFSNEKTSLKETRVMGVSHTINDENLISMLNNAEVDTLNNQDSDIRNAIDDIVVGTTITKEDAYLKSISKELEGEKKKQMIQVVIKKGDTLASLAEEYYSNPYAYDKIIEANSNLTQESHTIYVGQTINLPY